MGCCGPAAPHPKLARLFADRLDLGLNAGLSHRRIGLVNGLRIGFGALGRAAQLGQFGLGAVNFIIIHKYQQQSLTRVQIGLDFVFLLVRKTQALFV